MNKYRYGWLLLLVFAALLALSCNAIGDIAEKAGQVESAAKTAAALATAGQEFMTQVEGSGMIQTAEALATLAEESGLLSTVQAAVTEIPGDSADAVATLSVVITQGAYGEAPDNIPLVNDELNNFFGNANLVSYTTPMGFQNVVDFYTAQMPAYGWSANENDSTSSPSYAVLAYEGGSEKATVTISTNPLGNETIVLINIFH
ncbi:MAG: hypothetical protein HN413_05625 [Chloroflexi bacterium]|jgi:hypothetical protein|nr:hypothetical protein [Chloroflexota bacterium]